MGFFVEYEKVVVVAADGAGGAADSVQIEGRDPLRVQRKEVGLNLLGDGDLVLQTLLLLLFLKEALQGSGHCVEGAAQFGELVITFDADAVVKVAAVDVFGRTVEIGY